MGMGLVSKRCALAVLLILLPVLYQLYCPQAERGEHVEEDDAIVAHLSAKWEAVIGEGPNYAPGTRKIAVGVNANLDLIVSATALLRALNVTPAPPSDHDSLSSLDHLQDVVANSMLHCAGVERFFADQDIFQQTVEAAARLPHTYHIGGNAGLMAQKLQQELPEAQVILAAPVGTKLRALFHPKLLTPTFTADSHDEVHMILEYPVGETWATVKSTCANRVIYSHDLSNSRMVALQYLQEALDSFSPDLVILSGAHILEGQPAEVRTGRLGDIERFLATLPGTVPVHLELATVGDLSYLEELVTHLLSNVTSLGLNEQELVAVGKAMGADFDFEVVPAKPGVEHVSDLLHWLVGRFSSSKLSRVHFHSLSFHVVATHKAGPWGDGERSVVAGTRIAGLQACDTDTFNSHLFELRIPRRFFLSLSDRELSQRMVEFSPSHPVVVWERGEWLYHLSPVLVCKHPLKTVGLGDAISALGLIYSSITPLLSSDL